MSRFAEGADQQLDTFIGAAADQNLLRLNAGIAGIILNHRLGLAFRIAVQRLLGQLKFDGGREFIGVQPDIAFAAQAASRLIRRQIAHVSAG